MYITTKDSVELFYYFVIHSVKLYVYLVVNSDIDQLNNFLETVESKVVQNTHRKFLANCSCNTCTIVFSFVLPYTTTGIH